MVILTTITQKSNIPTVLRVCLASPLPVKTLCLHEINDGVDTNSVYKNIFKVTNRIKNVEIWRKSGVK